MTVNQYLHIMGIQECCTVFLLRRVMGEGGANSCYFRRRSGNILDMHQKVPKGKSCHHILAAWGYYAQPLKSRCQSLQLVVECVYRPCMHVNNRTWWIKRETSVFTWPTLTLTSSQCGCMPTGHALHKISRPSPERFSAISIAFSAASDKRWDKNLHGYEALCVSVHPIRLCVYGLISENQAQWLQVHACKPWLYCWKVQQHFNRTTFDFANCYLDERCDLYCMLLDTGLKILN